MSSRVFHASGKSPDPYELERLAEELVAREQAGSNYAPRTTASTELPIYVPLSHNNPHLTAEVFNVEEFLLSRSHTSLQDLRSELRDYLTSLKEELVLLINDDYEAFISLSTDLRGEGSRLERLKLPLGDLRKRISESRGGLQATQDSIQETLDARTKLREEKALLHLLLKISESVTRLESLLLISQVTTTSFESHSSHLSHLPASAGQPSDAKSQGNRAKHLSRVTAEYTQLLYHIEKAKEEHCAFVDEIRWRIDRIQSTLTSDLDHVFSAILGSLTDIKAGKVLDLERAKLYVDLTECLRIYDSLRLWRVAEEIMRRDVMQTFIKKTIFSDALATSLSPVLPHTPLPATLSTRTESYGGGLLPRTPYTPFTAFATKQNPFEASHVSGPVHLLDESNDALAKLYNQILRFIERDFGRIMELAERVSFKAGSTTSYSSAALGDYHLGDAQQASVDGFEIMTNVVWAEIGRAIMDELGTVVFAPGNPNEFRKHHSTTQAFIRSLEFLAPSTHSVQNMRSHPVFTAFQRRWQLSVYFQLRWKETVTKLEETLSSRILDPEAPNFTPGRDVFVTAQAADVFTAIASCWGAEGYIPDLSHRFWKFTLQLLSRYREWLESSLPPSGGSPVKPAANITHEKTSAIVNPPRSSTPGLTPEATIESTAADEILLRQFATALVDIRAMTSQVLQLWREEISMMLPDMSTEDNTEDAVLEAALRTQLEQLSALSASLSSQATSILSRRCCDALLPVRSIPSQFRAMSNKRLPSEPSYFAPTILRPVRVFFGIGTGGGPGERLKEELLRDVSTDVVESVCQRYIQYLTAMKKTEESLRRLKKGKKSTLSIFGSATAGKDDGKDEERIRAQMILDVEAFRTEGEALGVNMQSMDSFIVLDQMVRAELVDSDL
ncbi:oligomeric golgi complex component, COG2-domain-containing protein [Suillus clintonianus]|uniref:oligomeric golgi complex component, COG2-domain-containing protein n=1 Tax=Suillus clintonianus TaxID=1904413 RepID=UPI001B85F457|nr:oligomeric golgi complex component, COG2-domain-containing protein [Suillus clintonianus]KAG2150384.1 oligomeric golgi complex component, COG2-domain-containing protein [Suillus clintonianus]